MRRIAVIEDGFVRDSMVFSADPAIIEKVPDWENNYTDVKNPCQYVGIFEGETEDEIKANAAAEEGVHPGVISLVEL